MFTSGRWFSLTQRELAVETEFLNFLYLKVKDTHSSAILPSLESWLCDLCGRLNLDKFHNPFFASVS